MSPHYISILGKDRLVVHEAMNFVSIFDVNGAFLERKSLQPGLGIFYIGNDRYVGWRWTRDGKELFVGQVGRGTADAVQAIPAESFSVNVPDETGRKVMFNWFAEEYTPFFLFCQDEERFILGVSNRYELKVVDKASGRVTVVSRDIQPERIDRNERKYFAGLIAAKRNFPDPVKREFVKRIPKVKNDLAGVHLAGGMIWAVRMTGLSSLANAPVAVDLFSLAGKFLGTVSIPRSPLHVSAKYLYLVGSNSREDLLICRYRYWIEGR